MERGLDAMKGCSQGGRYKEQKHSQRDNGKKKKKLCKGFGDKQI